MNKAIRFCLLLLLLPGVAVTGNKGGKEARVPTDKLPSILTSVATPPATLFSEGFNDTALASPWPPTGWSMRNADGNVPDLSTTTADDTCWYQTLSVSSTGLAPYEGVAMAAAYYGTANGFYLDDWIISPNWGGTVVAGTVDSLVFWCTSRPPYLDSLQILVSTTDKNLASFTTVLGYIDVPKSVWVRVAYALPAATTRYIGFRYLMYDGGANGANSYKVCVDLVQVLRYTATAAGEPKNLVPDAYGLKQNYPNPFNPSTKISFALKNGGFTTLKVYNLLGQEVATLVNGELPAGSYEKPFDASGMTTGVYLYKLTSGSYSETRKMMLVK